MSAPDAIWPGVVRTARRLNRPHCGACPFRGCPDCPAPGGDPQGTLISAGGDGYGDVSAGGLDSGSRGKITDERCPRSAANARGPAGTAEESDMATIPPPSPFANPGGP